MEKWWWFHPGFWGFFYIREKIQNKKMKIILQMCYILNLWGTKTVTSVITAAYRAHQKTSLWYLQGSVCCQVLVRIWVIWDAVMGRQPVRNCLFPQLWSQRLSSGPPPQYIVWNCLLWGLGITQICRCPNLKPSRYEWGSTWVSCSLPLLYVTWRGFPEIPNNVTRYPVTWSVPC